MAGMTAGRSSRPLVGGRAPSDGPPAGSPLPGGSICEVFAPRAHQACKFEYFSRARKVRGAKPVASGGLAASSDQVGQVWNDALAWDTEPGAEVVPEAEAELGAGLGQAEKGVAAVASGIDPGAAADLAPGDLGADVVLRAVG